MYVCQGTLDVNTRNRTGGVSTRFGTTHLDRLGLIHVLHIKIIFRSKFLSLGCLSPSTINHELGLGDKQN